MNLLRGDYLDYRQYWNKMYKLHDELNSLIFDYWNQFSHMGTWQFWFVMSLLVTPLILLYFTVDRKRIFEIFFFGYSVHMLWTYTLLVLSGTNFFVHTYFLTPFLPFGLNMTASALPVGFLLVYQYTTNHNKNFYLCIMLLSAVFAFGFATFEQFLGVLEIRKGMNKVYLYLIDLAVAFLSYWLTKLVLKLRNSA
jgi:hypothetical protein